MNQSIKNYSKKRDGNIQLTANFKLFEFASKDGADELPLSMQLIGILQRMRDKCGKPITINSGYRSPAHNAKIGGAKDSQHMKGTAADLTVSGMTPFQVACLAEEVFAEFGVTVGGIGQYDKQKFTHIDVRTSSKWRCEVDKNKNLTGFWADGKAPTTAKLTLWRGSKGADVKTLQNALIKAGLPLPKYGADGDFGEETQTAVVAFQKARGLKVDGIVGANTWAALG
jgi:hypothetical protein